jgi:DNA-binding NtrC family response regulator
MKERAMSTILIIDDDDQLRMSFKKLLLEEGFRVKCAPSGETGLEQIRAELPDLVVLDMRLPGINGFETFNRIHEIEPKLPVIIMTAYGTTETAIKATKMGAYDYILKPFEIPDMLGVIAQALEMGRFMRSVDMDAIPDNASPDAIIGRSRPMHEVYKAIGRASPTSATILIRGESGTGKELVARAIFQHSLRASKPFMVVNCVAIPETLLESELFGYEKGAFTGASHRRIGKVEQATGGTLFLDEIGDMPTSIQAKILRLLQEKNIERLGGRETIPVDLRIIAATNRDLEKGISEGRFREDLYFRLNVVSIWLPPLRERLDDIPALTTYFLKKHSGETGVVNPGITEQGMAALISQPWPGNIRELSNTLQKALIFNQGAPIRAEDIAQAVNGNSSGQKHDPETGKQAMKHWIRQELTDKTSKNIFETSMDHYARILITEALNLTGGNRSQAARLLGMSRPTLHSKIEKYGLNFETSVKED